MTVIYLFRSPVGPGRVSIERLFNEIISNLPESYNVKSYTAPSPRANIFSLIWNMLYFLTVRFRNRKGIFHITGDIHYAMLALPPNRTVLTVHDLGFLNIKDGFKRKLIKLLWGTWPFKKCKNITAISEFTKNEITRLYPDVEKKLNLIPNFINPKFKYVPKKFCTDLPRLLIIGTSKNKNVEGLIEATKGLKCELRIIGKLEEAQIKSLKGSSINYTNESGISDEQVIQEYVDCDVVYFASFYEGFGLPILEAQATGRPVITTNIEPMNSVAGDAALFVGPCNFESIREAIVKLTNDEQFREKLISSGKKNVSKYTLERTVNLYTQLYSKIHR